MIKHIFIVAIRNLRTYYQQTAISSIALAIGFICFALSVYWIRYEMSFDTFHKKADRIYQVRRVESAQVHDQSTYTPPVFKKLMEKHFPQLHATSVCNRWYPIKDKDKPLAIIETDSMFFHLFDVTVLSGSFQENEKDGLLVTEQFARKHLPSGNPLGQSITMADDKIYTVKGIVKDWPHNTIFKFDAIAPIPTDKETSWFEMGSNYILLDQGSDYLKFKEKFENDTFDDRPDNGFRNIKSFTTVPLTEIYRSDTGGKYSNGQLTFEQVTFFALLGVLTILCALINYLNLYASRIQARFKDLSIRKVTGASNADIFGILITEFILLSAVSFIFGFIGIEYFLPAFKKFADIQSGQIHIYMELFIYIVLVICISLAAVSGIIFYSRKKLFRESIRIASPTKGKNLFGRLSILFQMIISLGIACSTAIYYKQIYTLGHKNPGFDRENVITARMSIVKEIGPFKSYQSYSSEDDINLLANTFKNNPSVTDLTRIPMGGELLTRGLPDLHKARTEKMNAEQSVEYDRFFIDPDYIRFYGIQLVAGNGFKPNIEDNGTDVIINETAVKIFGLTDPVGQLLFPADVQSSEYYESENDPRNKPFRIVGVVKDFAYELPTMKIRPVVMCCSNQFTGLSIRYKPGTAQKLSEEITTFVKENLPAKFARIDYMNALYTYRYSKEASLQSLIGLLSVVCIVISLFGVYSMVSLHAERKRKEIAIRKVNGASLFSIFNLFFKEYILLLTIAAAIAFPVGYVIMKPWTERYVLQTDISWWIYVLLFLLNAAIVLLTITARVWKTAHINPATELKKE